MAMANFAAWVLLRYEGLSVSRLRGTDRWAATTLAPGHRAADWWNGPVAMAGASAAGT
jgi:hypothetical protein